VVHGRGIARFSLNPKGLVKRAFRLPARRRAALVSTVAIAATIWWLSPAEALPSFSGQTGAPCAACHLGGFGPLLTPFGIQFKVNGYTMGGGTGPWAHEPFNLQLSPSFTNLGADRPTAPAGFGTNNFVTPGCASFLIAAGRTFDNGTWGVGGIGKMWINLTPLTTTHGTVKPSEAPSDFKFTKPITLKNGQPLVLGFDVNNKATEGDPWDNALYGYSYPLSFLGSNAVSNNAGPIVSSLGTSNYGTSVYAFWNNSFYAQIGIIDTMSSDWISALGKTPPPSIGFINGSAPYYRVAWQHMWGNNYLEVGALYLDAPVTRIPGIANPAAQNEFTDYGLDATYNRTFGQNTLTVFANILHEDQNRAASFASGRSTYPTDYLNQFRIAAVYDWNTRYEAIVAYNAIFGSADPALYPATAVTGSAAHSPDTQVVICEVNWTPNGSNTGPGFPWWNVRVGLQYRYYLEFNGGTTNYDGHGRNAADNNELLLYTMFSF
jgi:hypothetical protein